MLKIFMRFVLVKGKEVEVLADAVKKENMRLEAYRVRDKYFDFVFTLLAFTLTQIQAPQPRLLILYTTSKESTGL